MTSEPFVVVKQTPTKINIVNTTIANDAHARVYFQVLDQYGDVMEDYTEKKLTARAYNATKGHAIEVVTPGSKKDYLMLDCSTETITGYNYLNAIGDKIGLVVYLTDNAAVSCTAELEIVRVYVNELTFDDVKLGNDKRVTVGRTYEMNYTAKNNEGKDARFDPTMVTGAGVTTVTIGNYHFVSSNPSTINMTQFTINNDGNIEFVAGAEGTAVITAINTITGESSNVKIDVYKKAQLSGLDVADISVAYDTTPGTKVKAPVTCYDQFGEVMDPRNVKNTALASTNTLFSSVTTVADGIDITIDKITSDGKYVEYTVGTLAFAQKGRTKTFTIISSAMGESGYIRSTANVLVDDAREAAALEIVKAPDATTKESGSFKLQIAVKDQYQNKLAYNGDDSFQFKGTDYDLVVRDTNGILDLGTTKKMREVAGEDNVYELELGTAAVTSVTHESGTFTLYLKDGAKIIASKTFDLTVVKTIDDYTVKRDKDSYKAGDTIKVDVEAYSGTYFNPNFNGTETVDIIVNNTAAGYKPQKYTKTLTFKDGIASFELTAGKAYASDKYTIDVKAQNGACPDGTSDGFLVIGSSAAKLGVDGTSAQFKLYDSQGNNTSAWDRTSYATIKVTDEYLKADITGDVKIYGMNGGNEWKLNNDKTIAVHITEYNDVDKVGTDTTYNVATGLYLTNIPDTSKNHNIIVSVTIDGLTWEKKVAHGAASTEIFADTGAANASSDAAVAAAKVKADADYANVVNAIKNATATTDTNPVVTAAAVVNSSIVNVTATAITVSGANVTTASAVNLSNITNTNAIVSIAVTGTSIADTAGVEVTYSVSVKNSDTVNGISGNYEIKKNITVKYYWDATSSTWKSTGFTATDV